MSENTELVFINKIQILKNQILEKGNIPKHIAISMDGNGRWAKKRGLIRTEGHKKGAERVMEIIDACDEIGIKFLTLYAFSFENLQREPKEVSFFMEELLPYGIKKNTKRIEETSMKVNVMGELDYIPPQTLRVIKDLMVRTKNNKGMVVNFAVSYSGRMEILNAIQNIFRDIRESAILLEDLNEQMFSNYLYTAGYPDPDFYIRCGGVNRISNLMLWQMAYTELLAPGILWPDFDTEELYKAIIYFQKQPRKFGLVPGSDQ